MLNKEKEQTNKVKTGNTTNDAISYAKLYTSNVFNAALTISQLHEGIPDLGTLLEELGKQIEHVVTKDDINGLEQMLVTQAQTLNVVFHNMLIRATKSEVVPQMQVYSDIALKAQSQCRKTLAVLTELKNPKRTMFIKQQNLAINQQINNKANSENLKNIENPANELLIEAKPHETLELRRPREAIAVNPEMETVGEIDRGEDPRR